MRGAECVRNRLPAHNFPTAPDAPALSRSLPYSIEKRSRGMNTAARLSARRRTGALFLSGLSPRVRWRWPVYQCVLRRHSVSARLSLLGAQLGRRGSSLAPTWLRPASHCPARRGRTPLRVDWPRFHCACHGRDARRRGAPVLAEQATGTRAGQGWLMLLVWTFVALTFVGRPPSAQRCCRQRWCHVGLDRCCSSGIWDGWWSWWYSALATLTTRRCFTPARVLGLLLLRAYVPRTSVPEQRPMPS